MMMLLAGVARDWSKAPRRRLRDRARDFGDAQFRIFGEHAGGNFMMGLVQIELQNLDKARTSLRTAVNLDPTMVAPRGYLGAVENGFNWRFFTAGDSREPEQAGVWGAVVGTVFTMLVTLLMTLPLETWQVVAGKYLAGLIAAIASSAGAMDRSSAKYWGHSAS
ncbi:MAG: hypothetical protein HC794_02035 [Nitrospiraceae bacterium]|nr:hypothetical protein [Nitrospiraceae bacterium]